MSRKLTAAQQAALDALPPKRRAFVLAYVGEARGNQTRAAEIAGYAKAAAATEGSRLLTFAKVQEAVEALRAPGDAATLDRREQWLAVVVAWALEGHRVIKLPDQDPIKEPLEAKEQAKAIDMLGKSLGIYSEKREHSGAVTLEMVKQQLPFLARAKIAERRASEQEGSDDGSDTEGDGGEG